MLIDKEVKVSVHWGWQEREHTWREAVWPARLIHFHLPGLFMYLSRWDKFIENWDSDLRTPVYPVEIGRLQRFQHWFLITEAWAFAQTDYTKVSPPSRFQTLASSVSLTNLSHLSRFTSHCSSLCSAARLLFCTHEYSIYNSALKLIHFGIYI